MVYLSRIYTRSGDSGETGLGDGNRVLKSSLRVAAYGDVDELNSTLGVAITCSPNDIELLQSIQNDLFDVGADLCCPPKADEQVGKSLRITAAQHERLELEIDVRNDLLSPLRSFVLPGGSQASAWLHFTRAVCRRAERSVVALMQAESTNPNVLTYLNRLSDLLFVMARVANDNGRLDVLWKPGQSQSS